MLDLLSMSSSNPLVLCLIAFVCGFYVSFIAWKFLKASNPMILTVMVLPAVVCAALLAINGSLGAGIAILGVFGLVRFRSMPGSGTDIVSVFYAMVAGLMISTGEIFDAVSITIVIGLFIMAAVKIMERIPQKWALHILVPEDTENLEQFTSIVKQYASNVTLDKIRTTNMGSMYELVYSLVPSDKKAEMLDEIRVHNHNLNVALTIAKTDNML